MGAGAVTQFCDTRGGGGGSGAVTQFCDARGGGGAGVEYTIIFGSEILCDSPLSDHNFFLI